MNLQNVCHQPSNYRPYGYPRRIRRGSSERSDPLSRHQRTAQGHLKRIRRMEQNVAEKEDREALKAARRLLIEILSSALSTPTPSDTYQEIEDAMTEARRVYAGAKKATHHPRRSERPREKKGVRAKNVLKDRYTGMEDDEAAQKLGIIPEEDEHPEDPIAEAFQREIDAAMVNK